MSTMLAPVLRDRAELFALLSIWSERGWLRELDRALVQLFAELDPQASPLLLLGAALASHQLGQGHAMALVHVITKGPQISDKHVGKGGAHGDASDTAGGHRIMPRRETARKSRIG